MWKCGHWSLLRCAHTCKKITEIYSLISSGTNSVAKHDWLALSLHHLLMAILDMRLQFILPIATSILTSPNRAIIDAHSRLMLLSVTLHIRTSREGLVACGAGRASSTNRVAMCRSLRKCAAGMSIGGHVHCWTNGLGNALTMEPTWADSIVLSLPSGIESSETRITMAKGDLGGFGEMSLNVSVEGVK